VRPFFACLREVGGNGYVVHGSGTVVGRKGTC